MFGFLCLQVYVQSGFVRPGQTYCCLESPSCVFLSATAVNKPNSQLEDKERLVAEFFEDLRKRLHAEGRYNQGWLGPCEGIKVIGAGDEAPPTISCHYSYHSRLFSFDRNCDQWRCERVQRDLTCPAMVDRSKKRCQAEMAGAQILHSSTPSQKQAQLGHTHDTLSTSSREDGRTYELRRCLSVRRLLAKVPRG